MAVHRSYATVPRPAAATGTGHGHDDDLDDDDGKEFDLPSGDPTPVEMLLAGAQARLVRDCVDALDAGQKQAIALAFYQGLSHAELADHLRQPLGTVKSWVRRGLERLKGCLDRVGLCTQLRCGG